MNFQFINSQTNPTQNVILNILLYRMKYSPVSKRNTKIRALHYKNEIYLNDKLNLEAILDFSWGDWHTWFELRNKSMNKGLVPNGKYAESSTILLKLSEILLHSFAKYRSIIGWKVGDSIFLLINLQIWIPLRFQLGRGLCFCVWLTDLEVSLNYEPIWHIILK